MPAWWKQATPSRRAAIIFAALIAIGVIILLIVRKPWQWELPPGRKLRIVDCVRIYSWWAGAANCLLMIALAATASLVAATVSRRTIPPSTAAHAKMVFAGDNRGDASLRLVRCAKASSQLLG